MRWENQRRLNETARILFIHRLHLGIEKIAVYR
jgi:hypothetical protein